MQMLMRVHEWLNWRIFIASNVEVAAAADVAIVQPSCTNKSCGKRNDGGILQQQLQQQRQQP